MNVNSIRRRAIELSRHNFRLLVPSFYLINCVTLIAQYSSSGLIMIAIELLLVTLVHGFIYMSLILIHEKRNDFSINEIFIGIFHFAKYFPSYIVRKLLILIPTFVLLVPMFLEVTRLNNIPLYTVIDQFVYLFLSKTVRYDFFAIIGIQNISFVMVTFLVLALIVGVYLSGLFLLVPYIVEDYDYAWNEALIKSTRMMKGHVKDFIKLLVLLIPYYLIHLVVTFILSQFCFVIPYIGLSLYLILSMLSIIIFWQIPFYQSIAIFYLEVRNEEIIKHPHELFKI